MVHFPESHTSENIKRELTKIRVIVQDKGMNMVKGVKGNSTSFREVLHTYSPAGDK